jgi:hypothetical protein
MNRPKAAITGRPGIEGLGERLECVRKMRCMSQSDLATKIGLKPITGGMMVSHWECGRRAPHVKHLRAICLHLNVSADYLLNS